MSDSPATFDRGAAVTRSLLGYGVVAGPFYLVVSLIEAITKDGFDLTRHALSLLSNGPWGWVHVVALILTGLMVLAAAAGVWRAPGADGNPGPGWMLGVFGIGLMLSGVFSADPMDGFPVGTPDGSPESTSVSGAVHLAASGIGFIAVAFAALMLARIWRSRGDVPGARWSTIAGAVIIAGFLASVPLSSGGNRVGVLLLWIAVLTIWVWLAWASIRLYRSVPHPDGPHPDGSRPA